MALFAALDSYPGSRAWTTDVCVPIGQLPALIAETKQEMADLGLVAPICGHAGDGVRFCGSLFQHSDRTAYGAIRLTFGIVIEFPRHHLIQR